MPHLVVLVVPSDAFKSRTLCILKEFGHMQATSSRSFCSSALTTWLTLHTCILGHVQRKATGPLSRPGLNRRNMAAATCELCGAQEPDSTTLLLRKRFALGY